MSEVLIYVVCISFVYMAATSLMWTLGAILKMTQGETISEREHELEETNKQLCERIDSLEIEYIVRMKKRRHDDIREIDRLDAQIDSCLRRDRL